MKGQKIKNSISYFLKFNSVLGILFVSPPPAPPLAEPHEFEMISIEESESLHKIIFKLLHLRDLHKDFTDL